MDGKIRDVAHMQKVWDGKKRALDARIEEMKGKFGGGADELVDAVMQRSLEPYEVAVPLDDVIKEYVFDSYRISRCRNCFVWKTSGFSAVVKPVYNYDLSNGGGSLYSVLTEICDLADKKDAGTITDDEEKSYDISIMLVSVAFTLPVMMFSDTTFAINVYMNIMDEFKASLERVQGSLNDEAPEDIAKNQMFENMMMESEAARKHVAEAKKKGNKD